MRIVITGATGFVGRALCARFAREGHQVAAISRDAATAAAVLGPEIACSTWGPGASAGWRDAVAAADVVVNLAGEPIGASRWKPEVKKRIRASRVETTRLLVDTIAASELKPGALISASAIGYYGDRQDEILTEENGPGTGFLADVCREWEVEARRAESLGLRVACIRLGVVLGAGGALEKMLHPLPFPMSPWSMGLGGPLGSGRQWVPWIHQEDAVGMFFWAAVNPQVAGPVNAVAPAPLTGSGFARAIGRALHRPSFARVPGFVLRALVGEFAESLLGGQRALPAAAQRWGYKSRFSDIDEALHSLLAPGD